MVQLIRSRNTGSRLWWQQRISAIALIPLALLFLFPFTTTLGQSRSDVLTTWSHPWNALIAALFFATAFTHLHQGLREVIEDYVHGPSHRLLLLANTAFCLLFGLTALYAIAKIALT